jgi:hypothetical protein
MVDNSAVGQEDVSTRVCPASRNSGGRLFNNWEDLS